MYFYITCDHILEIFEYIQFISSPITNRKRSILTHYDYYIGDDKLILHRTTSLFWKVVITIGFPVVVLGYGIFNFKEVLKEYHELYNEKRLGHFSCDQCWSNTDTYAAVARIAKDSGQWG